MSETISVQVRFTEEHNGISFTDCLYFPIEDFASVNREQIDAMKAARVQGWIEAITAQSEQEAPEE